MTGAELRVHLHGEVLPLWARHGTDRERGGFYNELEPSLEPVREDRKRLLVQARQLWCFATAAAEGAPDAERWLELARGGFAFLRDRFLDRERGGWYRETTLAGEPLRREKDLYGHAFVLLALAAWQRAGGGTLSVSSHIGTPGSVPTMPGGFVIADGGDEIRYFDEAGRHVRTIGGAGDGQRTTSPSLRVRSSSSTPRPTARSECSTVEAS